MDYPGDISVNGAHGTQWKHAEKYNIEDEESDISSNDFNEETLKTTFLSGHVGLVTVVETDGQLAITGGEDGRVCVWDLSDGCCLYKIVVHTEPVSGLAFLTGQGVHPSEVVKGRTAVSGSKDGMISMWPFEFPRKMMSLFTDDVITCLKSLKDDFIIIGTERGKLISRRIDDLKKIDAVKTYSSSVLCLSVQTSTSSVACLDSLNTSICVWSFVHGQFKNLHTLSICSVNIDAPTVKFTCLSMRNGELYAGDDMGSLHVFCWKTGKKAILQNTVSDSREIVAILTTHEFLITCCRSSLSSESYLNIYEIPGYKLTRRMKFEVGDVVTLACAKSQEDAKFIVAGAKLAILEARGRNEMFDTENQMCENDVNEQKTEINCNEENVSAGVALKEKLRKRVLCVLF